MKYERSTPLYQLTAPSYAPPSLTPCKTRHPSPSEYPPPNLSNREKIGPDQVCVGRPSGLGRPGPDWDNRSFECPSSDLGRPSPLGCPSSAWAVPLGWAVPVRLGCLTWLGCPSSIWVTCYTSHVLTYADVPHLCFCRYGPAVHRKYKVHPRTTCAAWLVSALLRGAYHTFGTGMTQ